jgi:hypothetical protein
MFLFNTKAFATQNRYLLRSGGLKPCALFLEIALTLRSGQAHFIHSGRVLTHQSAPYAVSFSIA